MDVPSRAEGGAGRGRQMLQASVMDAAPHIIPVGKYDGTPVSLFCRCGSQWLNNCFETLSRVTGQGVLGWTELCGPREFIAPEFGSLHL